MYEGLLESLGDKWFTENVGLLSEILIIGENGWITRVTDDLDILHWQVFLHV